MEVQSVTVKANGEVSCEQPETTQQEHVFTTKVFLQMGPKSPIKEKPFDVDSNSNLQHEEDAVQDDVTNGNEISEERVHASRKHISEAEVVVVKKTEDDTKEDDTVTVESLLVNMKSVIDETLPDDTHEPANDTGEALEEDSPVVIEKRPVSLHLEHVINQDEIDEEKDKDVKDSHEKEVSDQHVAEPKEPITEDELVVVEKTHAALESEILVEKESPEDEEKQDDNATVESLLENIESVIDHRPPEQTQELFDEGKTEALEEDAPVVIEKRPVSLHMEQMLDQDQRDEGKEGDRKESDEKEFSREQVTEIAEPILETEPVVVEKTSTACILESEILVEREIPEDERKEDDNSTVESLLVNIESVIDDPVHTRESTDENKTEAIEEDAPVIIEKRPVSLHMEHMVDQNELEKTEGNEMEPIAEAELVVVERTPSVLKSEMLVENSEEAKEEDSTTVETLLVNIESVIDDTSPENTQELSEDKAEALEEDSPVVIEKRPVSLHMEHVLDQDDEKKGGDERKTISEAEPVVVKKTPVAIESDILVEKESGEDENKEDDTTTVTSLLVNIESVIDDTSPDRTQEPTDVEAKALEEDAPVVIEKRPFSLHMEHVIDKDDTEEHAKEFNGEREAPPKEPITEVEFVVVKKTPAALESDILIEKESPEDEGKEDDNATVESLLVNIVIDHQLPVQNRETDDKNKAEVLEEDAPMVIEKRPASLHIEQVLDQDEQQLDVKETEGAAEGEHVQTESREPISEGELVVVEKTPAALESELLIEPESPEDDNATLESLLVNIESVIDDTLPEQTEQETTRQPDLKEPIEEGAPLVVEKRRAFEPLCDLEVTKETPETSTEKADKQKSPPESPKIIDEVVINVTEKKRTYGEQSNESQENESGVPEESSSDIVLDIPQVERNKDIEDTALETVPPAVVRKAAEPHHGLLQTVEADEPKEEHAAKEVGIRETEILDDDEGREPVKEADEINDTKTEEVEKTTTTEETLKSTSYTKLVHKDEGDDEALLRHVLVKRLSAPEVLPETENDGSAPLAPSESGILDSKEHVPIEGSSPAREATPKSTVAKPDAASSEKEPCKDGHDKEKRIPDDPEEVKLAENVEGTEKPLPREEDEQGLLDVDDEDKADKTKTKGRKGLSSPQCKCCSLM